MGINDYIETLVVEEKSDSTGLARRHDVADRREVRVVNKVRLTRVGDVTVNSLMFDEDESLDDGDDPNNGDPYNSDPYNSAGKRRELKSKE